MERNPAIESQAVQARDRRVAYALLRVTMDTILPAAVVARASTNQPPEPEVATAKNVPGTSINEMILRE